MDTLKLAVIGLGKVAKPHLEAYRRVAGVIVAAGADIVDAQREWAEKQYGIVTYADYREMIAREKPDLVCILAPARIHAAVAIHSMNNGCHVICEKPLALNLADGHAMKQAAERNGVKFFYGASYRYLPALLKAKSLIASGAIGDVHLVTEEMIIGAGAENRKEMGDAHYPENGIGGSGSGLVDHGVHLIDAFPWLIGDNVVSVYGQGNMSGADAIPEFAVLKFSGGAVGRLTYFDSTFPASLPGEGAFSQGGSLGIGKYLPPGAWLSSPGQIFVYGDCGALRIQHYANYLYLFNGDGCTSAPLEGASTPENFGRQLSQAVEDIRGDMKEAVGIEVGIEALTILLAIYQSQKQNSPVSIR